MMSVKAARPAAPAPDRAAVFDTDLGWCALRFRDRAVARIAIGHESAADAVGALASFDDTSFLDVARRLSRWQSQLVKRLQGMLAGGRCDFSDVPLDLAGFTKFQRDVLAACRKIPWGQTLSYGDLARRARSPGAARAVGQCMAGNRFPLVVPCHRVLGAGGRIGGFSAPRGLELKRALLQLERGANG